MNDVDLGYAFTLSPEQAVAYFRQKGFTFSWDWHDTWQQAQARGFTVAKALRLDVLQDIRGAVDKALAEGRTFEQFRKELTPLLQAKGWWGKALLGDGAGGAQVAQLGSPRRLQTIYQVNLQTAYMAGRYKSMMENAAARPYWMYSAVLDGRTRPAHRSLHGIIARYDSPFWRHFYPPNGWRCRCRVRALTEAQAIAMVKDGRGRWVSEANLGTAEALVSPTTGELAEVATYRAGQRIVSPDVGWSYNPGQAWMEPFTLRPFDPDLGGGYKSVGAAFHPKTPLAELAAKRLDPGLLLPPHQASGWSEAQYVNTFLTEFGARADTPVVFRDVIDDPLVISAELFRDRKSNTFKVFKGDREIYLRLLADTIKDPVEIWLSEVELGGRVRICKRYVGLYQNEQQKAGGYVIFDLVDDHWQGTTAFRPERLTYLETQRVGTLLYTKK